VERALLERAPDVGPKVRAGLSRNDRVATALRLWLIRHGRSVALSVCDLIDALMERAREHPDALMPGYTHLQRAQPVRLSHHLMAHAFAFERDVRRMLDALGRTDVSPLGAGALAGSTLDLDAHRSAHDLGFGFVAANSIDAVSDRDFVTEFCAALAIAGVHASRLGEEIVLWTTAEFGFAELSDAFSTGSSLMPQKKNPDALELVRGKAARVDADVLRLLALMKGLPAGYQEDLQEDKEAVFDAADTTAASLAVMAGVVGGLTFDRDAMRKAAAREEMMAAGLAVALAREGMPFRQAHALVGTMVAEAARSGVTLREAAARALPTHSPAVAARLAGLFDPDQAVRAKAVRGGTAPEAVRESLEAALKRSRD
jgi:argininosuccinate lyase